MIDVEKMSVGDVIYAVDETNHAFHRKKIKTVFEGQEWFRYEKPLRSYKIMEYKIVGILKKRLDGEWPDGQEYDKETEFYISKDPEGVNDQNTYYCSDLNQDIFREYFATVEEAQVHKVELELKAKELDES